MRASRSWEPLWPGRLAPARWSAADSSLAGQIVWRMLRPGLDEAFLDLSLSGLPVSVRVVLARLDPARFRLILEERTRRHGLLPDWSIDLAPADAALAYDAGQFQGGLAWGWLVRGGREELPPLHAPLAAAVVGDSSGGIGMWCDRDVAARRERGGVEWAFESYPILLEGDGEIAAAWARPDPNIDVGHRDSRLAMGWLRDGRLLFLLTRVESPGALDRLPLGPTSAETAALMGAVGCARAVMLDGGISGQLLLRGSHGPEERWAGLRSVPIGIVALPR